MIRISPSVPRRENIYFADYPMRLPFHIVYRMDRAGFLLPLIKYLLSGEMAANFIAANMVPLPEQLRLQMRAELDLSPRRFSLVWCPLNNIN